MVVILIGVLPPFGLAAPSAAASPSGSLALTVSSGGIEWTGIVGAVLIVLGLAVAVLIDAPRRILQRIRLRKSRAARRQGS